MDYTDGSKEAKLLQELLHLLEEAILRGGGTMEGFMPELIMKEMQEKGFTGNDFATVVINPKYAEDYKHALTRENLPYLAVPDVHGNTILIVRSADASRMLDVDATIKKGLTEFTRDAYIADFFRNEKKLGHEIYRIKMDNSVTQSILADKAFTHEAGFVTSYSAGYCYFSETAVNGEVANIFLDTALTSNKETFIGRIKNINQMHEKVNQNRIFTVMKENKSKPVYFVNQLDNQARYLKIQDGILEIHSRKGGLDTKEESYNIKDYKSQGEASALDHVISQALSQVYNCDEITEDEFASFLTQSPGQLAVKADDALLASAKVITDLQTMKTPKSMADNFMYIKTDTKSLSSTTALLYQKMNSATSQEERAEYQKQLTAINKLKTQKEAQKNFQKIMKSDLHMICTTNREYQFMTKQKKIEFELKTMCDLIDSYEGEAATQFFDSCDFTREELKETFKDNYETLELVTPDIENSLEFNQNKSQTLK